MIFLICFDDFLTTNKTAYNIVNDMLTANDKKIGNVTSIYNYSN